MVQSGRVLTPLVVRLARVYQAGGLLGERFSGRRCGLIRHAIAIVLCLLLVSCGGGFPIPIPSPPFPIPPPAPATPFVCTAPAVPRGTVVRVPNAQPGRYIAVLLPRAQVEQMRALAAGAQPEPTRTVWAQAEVHAGAAR